MEVDSFGGRVFENSGICVIHVNLSLLNSGFTVEELANRVRLELPAHRMGVNRPLDFGTIQLKTLINLSKRGSQALSAAAYFAHLQTTCA